MPRGNAYVQTNLSFPRNLLDRFRDKCKAQGQKMAERVRQLVEMDVKDDTIPVTIVGNSVTLQESPTPDTVETKKDADMKQQFTANQPGIFERFFKR